MAYAEENKNPSSMSVMETNACPVDEDKLPNLVCSARDVCGGSADSDVDFNIPNDRLNSFEGNTDIENCSSSCNDATWSSNFCNNDVNSDESASRDSTFPRITSGMENRDLRIDISPNEKEDGQMLISKETSCSTTSKHDNDDVNNEILIDNESMKSEYSSDDNYNEDHISDIPILNIGNSEAEPVSIITVDTGFMEKEDNVLFENDIDIKEEELTSSEEDHEDADSSLVGVHPTPGISNNQLPFSCTLCGRAFKAMGNLAGHILLEHPESSEAVSSSIHKKFSCDVCGKRYSRKDTLVEHIAKIHPITDTDDTVSHCKVCGKMFESKLALGNHSREHRNPPYKCDICQSEFRCIRYIQAHVAMHLEGKAVCPVCGNEFMSRKNLARHMDYHIDEINFLCELCGMGFGARRQFMKHMHAHTGPTIKKPLICDVCGKAFRDKGNLANHMHKHSDSKEYLCNICGKGMKDKRTLKYHMDRHRGENQFKCPICEKTFAYASYRTVHMRCHTREKPYRCAECDKTFSQKSSLNTHMKRHLEKSHVCEVCGKSFALLNYLKVHMNVHAVIKPFKCQNCPKRYTQKGTLNLHMKNCI